MPDSPDSAPHLVPYDAETAAAEADPIPEWFIEFLNDRQTRKPSAHTMKAYRQDFVAIARPLDNSGRVLRGQAGSCIAFGRQTAAEFSRTILTMSRIGHKQVKTDVAQEQPSGAETSL